jgi:hypothetical protein
MAQATEQLLCKCETLTSNSITTTTTTMKKKIKIKRYSHSEGRNIRGDIISLFEVICFLFNLM